MDKIDFATFCYYTETPGTVSISNVGGYNYKKISGTEITVNVKAGEKYLLLGNGSIRPSNNTEVYLMVRANGNPIGSSALTSNVAANGYTNLTKNDMYQATSDASIVFSLYTGTTGANTTSVDVLRGASLSIIRIA